MARRSLYNLTEGSVLSGMWRLSLPMVGSMILHDVLQLVDLFFLGRLGAVYVAGLTMGGVFVETFYTLAMGISTGTVAMVARHVGAGKRKEAHNVVVQSIFIGLALSLIMTGLGLFLSDWALTLIGTTGEVKVQGAVYLRIVALGSVFIFVPFNLNSALRGAGDAVTPLKIMAVSNVLNIILAPLLIFGLLGFPRWEMAGAAWAVVFSRGVGALLTCYVFLSGTSFFRLQALDMKLDLPVMWTLIRIGFFGSLQMLFRNISALFMARLVAVFGVTAMAAYGIVIRLRMSVLLPGMAIGNAAATLVGQNLGAGKPERAVKSGWAGVGFYAVFMLCFTFLFILFANELVGVFNQSPEVIAEGSLFLKIFSATFIFLAFSSVLGRAITGAGDTFSPMVITGLIILGLRIPLAYLLSLSLGPAGIWLGMALSNVVQGVVFTVWFHLGRWKKVMID